MILNPYNFLNQTTLNFQTLSYIRKFMLNNFQPFTEPNSLHVTSKF